MSEPCRHEREVERQQVRVELARLQRDYEIQRRKDVVDEYRKAGRSWDTSRFRLTAERDAALATIERVRAVIDLTPAAGHGVLFACIRAALEASS